MLPTDDFELIYTVCAERIGANLLSYFDPATGQGTFMLLAAPGIGPGQAAVAKDVHGRSRYLRQHGGRKAGAGETGV